MSNLDEPEDLVIYKAIAWRPQDQQDVERLLALHGARMDLARLAGTWASSARPWSKIGSAT